MLVFEERGKPEYPETRTNNKLNPDMTPGLGIEPGPHWWETSALTTAPSLLPYFYCDVIEGHNKCVIVAKGKNR